MPPRQRAQDGPPALRGGVYGKQDPPGAPECPSVMGEGGRSHSGRAVRSQHLELRAGKGRKLESGWAGCGAHAPTYTQHTHTHAPMRCSLHLIHTRAHTLGRSEFGGPNRLLSESGMGSPHGPVQPRWLCAGVTREGLVRKGSQVPGLGRKPYKFSSLHLTGRCPCVPFRERSTFWAEYTGRAGGATC